jgi:hypothetical protein
MSNMNELAEAIMELVKVQKETNEILKEIEKSLRKPTTKKGRCPGF